MKKLLSIVGLSVVLVACSSTPADQNAAPVDDRNPLARTTVPGPGSTTNPAGSSGLTGAAIAPGTGSTASTQAGPAGRTPLNDPASILSKRSVFYDFDSFVVKDEYKPLIEAHGKYLRDNKSARIIIQGNTDERGGREYNLALGHKRAESVKKMLAILGVQEAQVETISFGKEKPRNPGTDEAAYAENRRSDIVYQGE
jgi:peptidoglycan-associated lipoprotein